MVILQIRIFEVNTAKHTHLILHFVTAVLRVFVDDFCYGRYAGHYAHPGSYKCFVQCDQWGTAYAMPCAYGTTWQSDGYEPAYGNMCQSDH